MTDASQEGTLQQRVLRHFNKMVSADNKHLDAATSLGEMGVIATLDYLASLGVPIDSLEQGRMERIEMRRYVTSDLQTAYVIVPDSTPEGAGE